MISGGRVVRWLLGLRNWDLRRGHLIWTGRILVESRLRRDICYRHYLAMVHSNLWCNCRRFGRARTDCLPWIAVDNFTWRGIVLSRIGIA